MKIHVRVSTGNNVITTLEEAVKSKKVAIIKEELVPVNKSSNIYLSTLLVDDNGNEIFENDIVCDSDGRLFRIVYYGGAFWANSIDSDLLHTNMPLIVLQSNGCVPVKVQIG